MKNYLKDKIYILSLLLGIFLALLSCLSANGGSGSDRGAPVWYLDTDKVYPSQDYLAVRGKGSTEREAKRDAAGELATLFSAKVNFDAIGSFRYSELDSGSSKAKEFSQTTRVRSDLEISGLEYSKPFRAGQQVYIVAYLDRKKVGKLYSERIAERRSQIAELRRRARKFNPADNDTKNLLSGFILYDYSLDQALRNQTLLEQLQIINKPMHEGVAHTIDYNSVELAKERSKFASRLSFAMNYNGDEELTFLGENMAQQFTKLGFVRRQSSGNALVVEVGLKLYEIETDNRYVHLNWDLGVKFTFMKNADGSGSQTSLLEFSKSGRESGISRSRAVTTLKRLLDEQIQNRFMSRVYAHFARFAGLRDSFT